MRRLPNIPASYFGAVPAARDRVFVYLHLAMRKPRSVRSAEKMVVRQGFTEKKATEILEWLRSHLYIEAVPTAKGSMRYKVLPDTETAYRTVQNDPIEIAARKKAEEVRERRSEAAQRRWAEKRAASTEQQAPEIMPAQPQTSFFGIGQAA